LKLKSSKKEEIGKGRKLWEKPERDRVFITI
jgi:hypothetical protein